MKCKMKIYYYKHKKTGRYYYTTENPKDNLYHRHIGKVFSRDSEQSFNENTYPTILRSVSTINGKFLEEIYSEKSFERIFKCLGNK